MKIAFISALPFGLRGSAGTYLLIEKMASLFECIVCAPIRDKNIVFKSKKIRIVPIGNLSNNYHIKRAINEIIPFDPDLIYLFNFPGWPGLIKEIKKVFPNKKCILDIKSPLLAEGSKRREIQNNGHRVIEYLDAIVTPAIQNIETWLPNCNRRHVVYPLGINLSVFKPGFRYLRQTNRHRFVYVGVLHPYRQLDILIDIFSSFIIQADVPVTLDIIGNGPDYYRLAGVIKSLSVSGRIRLRGLYQENKLAKALREYDAGIAWVPYEKYNYSPSLKILEYMASGLAILASDTYAHKHLKERGYSIDFFSNNKDSLLKCFKNYTDEGFSSERIEANLTAIKQADYSYIINNFFLPLFTELGENKNRLIRKKDSPGFRNLTKNHNRELRISAKFRHKRILIIGPLAFKPGVWETRAAYIFPDLFGAMPGNAQIYMLTGKVTDAARASLNKLCNNYGVIHIETGPNRKKIPNIHHMQEELTRVAREIGPDVITNVFAPVLLGKALCVVAKNLGARSVLRIAGDEIATRKSLYKYDNNPNLLTEDIDRQSESYVLADNIIVMSLSERRRVCKELLPNQHKKVNICIRGVDLMRFQYRQRDYHLFPVKRFLFVGRKSMEKGYDILEEAAKIVYKVNRSIEFIFAGSFQPKRIENRNYIGWVNSDDLPRLFSNADAFILTSRVEGFPQVAAEAMASGLPCILSEHIFLDILHHEHDALLIPLIAKNVAEAVLRLHDDQQLSGVLSLNARRTAELTLGKKVWAERYRAIMEGDNELPPDPFSYQLKKRMISTIRLRDDNIRTKKTESLDGVSEKIKNERLSIKKKPKSNDQKQFKGYAYYREPNSVLKHIHCWFPQVPLWKPLRKKTNSSLRIAAITSNRLYHGFRFEGEVLLLTPTNWRNVLHYGKPDILLIEATWTTATGHWRMAQIPSSPEHALLLKLIKYANKLHIPTIFWNTKSYLYHRYYYDFASRFDYVFCADAKEIERMRSESIHAKILLPCVQPAIYNPFRLRDYYDNFSIEALFDGWIDIDRYPDDFSALKEAKKIFKTSIIESRYSVFKNRMKHMPDFNDSFLGCVAMESKILCLKYAQIYLSFNKSTSSSIERMWMALEAAASHLPIVHMGLLNSNDLRNEIVLEHANEEDFIATLNRFKRDPMLREKQGHLGWRSTYLKHTFSHRLQSITNRIGIDNDWNEYPKISVVTPTYRRENFLDSIRSFNRQAYQNKELIIVLNENRIEAPKNESIFKHQDNVIIKFVPEDLFTGAALNLGNLYATGEYYFKMDDDDYYSENYILDMMLHLRAVDADFFGKPSSYFVHYPDMKNVLHYITTNSRPLCVITDEYLKKKKFRITGNSFAGRSHFFRRNRYIHTDFGSADTSFFLNADLDNIICVTMDHFNMSVERRQNLESHTWRATDRVFKNLKKINNHLDYVNI